MIYRYDGNDRLLSEKRDDLVRTVPAGGQPVYSDVLTTMVYTYENVQSAAANDGTILTRKAKYAGDNPSGTGTPTERINYSYNLQGRQSRVHVDTDRDGFIDTGETRVDYRYNDDGMRVTQTDNTVPTTPVPTKYVVDAQNPTGFAQLLEERNSSNAVTRSYVLGLDVISQATSSASTGVRYLLYDGHGSTRALTNSAGAIQVDPKDTSKESDDVRQVFDYDAYGNALGSWPAIAETTLLYSGEWTDAQTGQQYLRARYYDPATGRFNRVDPLAGEIGDPLSLHRYIYGNADPIRVVDPTGMFGLAGLAAGFGIANSLRSIKLEADLAAFDAAATTLAGVQAGQNATQIFISFFANQALGFGVGLALSASARWTQYLLDNGIPFGGVSRIGAAGDSLAGLRNTRNFKPGRLQQSSDTCGLYCAGAILDEIAPNRASTSLDAAFGTTAHQILLQRGGKGLSTVELRHLLNANNVGAIIHRNVSAEGLESLLSRGSVISHVDGNHFVHPLRVFDDNGAKWVRVYDPARGHYDQLLDSFVTRSGPNNEMILVLGT